MTSRMLSTQQVNRRHEEKLQALEEQLNAQRMRVKMKLWEDTQRLQHDLIQLSIRTPSTCGEFTGGEETRLSRSAYPAGRNPDDKTKRPAFGERSKTDVGLSSDGGKIHLASGMPMLGALSSQPVVQNSESSLIKAVSKEKVALPQIQGNVLRRVTGDTAKKEHKASEHLLQQVIGKKEHKGLETPTVENRGKVRFVASQVQQPSLPTVEVRGCNVHLHYQQSQGRPSHTKTFHPDSKTRTLLIRSSRVTDSLSRLSQRKASRFSHQEDVPEFSHDVRETQTTAEEHDAASEWSVQQKDVVASRQSSGNPSGVLALNAVASARKAFRSINTPRRPSKVLDHSGSSVSGWQLMRFYSLWTTSRKTPTWATSSYLRRKVLEDRKHRRRSARPRQRIQAAMLQAVSVLESGKKAQMENDNGGGGDGGGGGVKAAARLWMTSAKSGLSDLHPAASRRPSEAASVSTWVSRVPDLQPHNPDTQEEDSVRVSTPVTTPAVYT